MSDALPLTEAVGLLRSGASPGVVWREVFSVGIDSDGAPLLVGDDPVDRAVCAAARLAHRSGAPLAEVLERVAEFAHAGRRAALAREAALAGPRASATALQWMPLAGTALAVIVEPASLGILTGTALGWTLTGCAVGLVALGRAWMRRLVRSAERAGTEEVEQALLVALIEAGIAGGLDVRSALAEAGRCVRSPGGDALGDVAARLGQGASWREAWGGGTAAESVIERALRSCWISGASPSAPLRATAEGIAERSAAAVDRAAGELGVRVTLPLALCFLPAFALVGVLPLVLSLASNTLSAFQPLGP